MQMLLRAALVVLSLAVLAPAEKVTPVQKVIQLLEGMHKQGRAGF